MAESLKNAITTLYKLIISEVYSEYYLEQMKKVKTLIYINQNFL